MSKESDFWGPLYQLTSVRSPLYFYCPTITINRRLNLSRIFPAMLFLLCCYIFLPNFDVVIFGICKFFKCQGKLREKLSRWVTNCCTTLCQWKLLLSSNPTFPDRVLLKQLKSNFKFFPRIFKFNLIFLVLFNFFMTGQDFCVF